jgi:hypothetical protein
MHRKERAEHLYACVPPLSLRRAMPYEFVLSVLSVSSTWRA